MYSTCLFCNERLGRNESIEHFPVGRRLAFDAAKGRLWVVCRRCERWNLTPLEERWEAIEECERAFRDTRLRVSSGEIGLARLREGTELVRIGTPQRPEMAAWRYGDQFGRRRRRRAMLMGSGAIGAGVLLFAGPALGVAAGMTMPLMNMLSFGHSVYRSQKRVHTADASGSLAIRLNDAPRTQLYTDHRGLVLSMPLMKPRSGASWWTFDSQRETHEVTGEPVIRVAGALLPALNANGGSARQVTSAVEQLQEAGSASALFRRAAKELKAHDGIFVPSDRPALMTPRHHRLASLPIVVRLALEMTSHEESERRAMEGELHELEAAWKAADEIAGIADSLLLPESVERALSNLRRSDRARRDDGEP